MKVLTVVSNLGPGGTQRVAQNYAVGYASQGIESAVLAYQGGGPREVELRASAIETFVAVGKADAVGRAGAWGPDVVHVHREGGVDPESAEVLTRLRTVCPKASWVETNVFSRADPTETGELFDLHFQLSEWCLWKWSRRTRHLRPRPLGIVLPNATDTVSFYPDPEAAQRFRQEHGIPQDAVLIGRIGQPIVAKWMSGFGQAFESVARREPRARLLVVGYPEELRHELDALPPEIRARVHELSFLHGDDALRAVYSAIDVFAHSSHKGESFGMVLVESMLCETPVVTRSRPARDNSQVEVVGHREGGLVAADDDGFVDAIATLVADPDLRRHLGRAGAQKVRRQYHVDRVVPDMVRAVEAVRATGSRAQLAARLRELGFTTSVSSRTLWTRLESVFGRTPLRERVLAAVVDRPGVHALWTRLRR